MEHGPVKVVDTSGHMAMTEVPLFPALEIEAHPGYYALNSMIVSTEVP